MTLTYHKSWIDNLRTFTVFSVVIYHVVWIFNVHSAYPDFIHFSDEQYQDAYMYWVYPWFMVLLFLIAGICTRYALDKQTAKSFLLARTYKLLIPSTVGVVLFHWIMGYVANDALFWAHGELAYWDNMPIIDKYKASLMVGIGHLWFIQLLWVYSVIIILIRVVERDKLYKWLEKYCPQNLFVLFGVVYMMSYAVAKTVFGSSDNPLIQVIIYQYRPFYYFVPYTIGYYLLSQEKMIKLITKHSNLLLLLSAVSSIGIVFFTWHRDPLTASYLKSWYNVAYAWIMCLMFIGVFSRYANYSNNYTQYAANCSYGVYILHMFVVVILGYVMFRYMTLPPWSMYVLLALAALIVPALSFVVLKQLPVISFLLFGIYPPPRMLPTS